MEKGKGKGRWKEDSLRNVGRTDGHAGDFILCPSYALHWTDKKMFKLQQQFTNIVETTQLT